jgi:hypothetical protein
MDIRVTFFTWNRVNFEINERRYYMKIGNCGLAGSIYLDYKKITDIPLLKLYQLNIDDIDIAKIAIKYHEERLTMERIKFEGNVIETLVEPVFVREASK